MDLNSITLLEGITTVIVTIMLYVAIETIYLKNKSK